MKISAKCEYACRAVLELSLQFGGNVPVQIQTIAGNQNIPEKYLVQILLQLKGAGFVASIRGKEGGYYLTKPPKRITLGEIIREIDGPLLSLSSVDNSTESARILKGIWQNVESSISGIVDNKTFEEISNEVERLKAAGVYHI
ncbi:Rrf2 family transcriptional regulator [bacterium]|nr:Rrf2 family transcriptional regulator [bacterium]